MRIGDAALLRKVNALLARDAAQNRKRYAKLDRANRLAGRTAGRRLDAEVLELLAAQAKDVRVLDLVRVSAVLEKFRLGVHDGCPANAADGDLHRLSLDGRRSYSRCSACGVWVEVAWLEVPSELVEQMIPKETPCEP